MDPRPLQEVKSYSLSMLHLPILAGPKSSSRKRNANRIPSDSRNPNGQNKRPFIGRRRSLSVEEIVLPSSSDEVDDSYASSEAGSSRTSKTRSVSEFGEKSSFRRYATEYAKEDLERTSSNTSLNSEYERYFHFSNKTKKFLHKFESVPQSESVINYYVCATFTDFLYQGTLYITKNYLGFYSNIFGQVNKTLIPISSVFRMKKGKTAKVIPNALIIETSDGKKHVFGSLISRDSTFKFINSVWKRHLNYRRELSQETFEEEEEYRENDSETNSFESSEDGVFLKDDKSSNSPSVERTMTNPFLNPSVTASSESSSSNPQSTSANRNGITPTKSIINLGKSPERGETFLTSNGNSVLRRFNSAEAAVYSDLKAKPSKASDVNLRPPLSTRPLKRSSGNHPGMKRPTIQLPPDQEIVPWLQKIAAGLAVLLLIFSTYLIYWLELISKQISSN